jgi:iron complex transport system substrate-binding protein
MQPIRTLCALLTAGALALTACAAPLPPVTTATDQSATAPTSAAAEELSIVDGAGNTLTFTAPPQRLVCTYSRCMEVLAALELEPVGVTTWEEDFIKNPLYFPQPTQTEILSYDGDFPDLERLAVLKPDLVFGWQELGDALQGIAPVYNVVNEQDSYAKSHAEIRTFAGLLGRTEIAERNIQRALDQLAAYKAKAPGDLSVMYGFFYQGVFSYRDGNSGTCNLLKEVADCNWPDPTNSSSWSVEVGDEGLLQFDPDVILVDSYGFDGKSDAEIIAEVSARPLWGELTAVKTGRVYVSSDTVANMDGMGTVGMMRMLDVYAPLLYPEIFPTPLTDEQVQEILAQ